MGMVVTLLITILLIWVLIPKTDTSVCGICSKNIKKDEGYYITDGLVRCKSCQLRYIEMLERKEK